MSFLCRTILGTPSPLGPPGEDGPARGVFWLFFGFVGWNGLVSVFATRRVRTGLVEGFRVDYGGVKTAGLDLGIRLVLNVSGGSGA